MYLAQTKSSFNGIINEIPDISVDNFEKTGFKAYFLSHCHTDHTNGLFSEPLINYLSKNQVFIYTSELSAAIIAHESVQKKEKSYGPSKDIMDFVMPLKIIEPTTITIPGEETSEDQYVTVTLIPAAHCFGSVMFLFKTLYKTILYTGDFRIGVNSVSKYAQLHDNGDIIKLDALYVDTTFQNYEHDDFPKRSDSVEVIVRYIKKWLNAKESNQVALHTSAKYGYEFVYKDIFTKLQQKVYVDEDLWRLYSQHPKAVQGVTNDPNARIHRCRNRHESQSHDACFPGKRTNVEDFLFVHFSAYKWKGYQTDDTMIEIKNGRRIDVCFATHCSRSELEYFVNYLAPKKIIGFPNEYVRRTEKCTPSKRIVTKSADKNSPPVKVAKVLDREIVRKIFAD